MPSSQPRVSCPNTTVASPAPLESTHSVLRGVLVFALAILACASPDQPAETGSDAAATADATNPATESTAPLVQLLAEDQVLFGVFSGLRTAEQGAEMGRNRELDFVFYSLESGPFDIMTTKVYMSGIAEGSAPETPHPLVLRVPAIRDGADRVAANVAEALAAGVAAIVFPHVESAEDAAVSVSVMGDDLWPGNPSGSLFSILIIEDQAGVERADEIVGTPGVSVVFPGPADLRRAYEGDMEAVEAAIQTVLASCKRHDVPCGITAGVDDIAERIEQGFRMFIVSDPAAVTVGRGAVGRG